MNKRHRAILTALQPATDYALQHGKAGKAPGLSMTMRVSADAAAELMIYGEIGGGGWFSDGITASDVAASLKEIGPGPVNVRLNSGGGDVFDGVAIHSLLARHPGVVTVYVDGLAASAASFIMLAGDHIVGARNCFVMIHDAMTSTYGNGDTHRESADLLDKVSANIADMYSERAGEEPEFWRALMIQNGENGTWYTGQEALSAGLVDELTTVPDDMDEDSAVADRLKVWSAILPPRAREFISEHPVEDDDEQDDPAQSIEQDETTEDEQVSEFTDADRDMDFAMLAALTR
jgi:ATP-dependent protease ClpP protease subunit